MSSEKERLVTVQGVGNPVPAEGSEQAGSQQSRSSNCNVTTVANLADVTDKSTSDGRGNGKSVHGDNTPTNPFRKSGMIQRSPKKVATTSTLERCFSSPSLGSSKAETKEITLTRLGRKIEELAEFVKPRNNVHSEIKRMVSTISMLYGSATSKMKVEEKECQTSPLLRQQITSKKLDREEASNENTPLGESSKRRLSTPPKSDEGRQNKKRNIKAASQGTSREDVQALRMSETLINKEDGNRKQNTTPPPVSDNVETTAMNANQLENDPIDPQEGWQRVKEKRKRKGRARLRRKRVRPDALLIKKSEEMSFADLLRKVKVDPTLTTLGEKVSSIRQTHSGDLLLELQTTGDQPQTSKFRDQLATAIGDGTSVKGLTQETLLVIKDIDEVTTSEEVREAVEAQFDDVRSVCTVKSLTKAYRGTQTAVISIPNTIAGKVLEVGKVRIGWVSCRIREKIQIIRCFKCHGFGHLSWNCRSGADRSKFCRRCGEEGHFAKSCQKDSKCMLCDETAEGCSKHTTGSYRCPAYQKALQIERRK